MPYLRILWAVSTIVPHGAAEPRAWVNLVERWFKELTDKRLRRGAFTSVPDLIAAREKWAAAWNQNPKPLFWHTPADEILAKGQCGQAALRQINSPTDH